MRDSLFEKMDRFQRTSQHYERPLSVLSGHLLAHEMIGGYGWT